MVNVEPARNLWNSRNGRLVETKGMRRTRDALVNQVEEAIEIRDPGATNSRVPLPGQKLLGKRTRPRFFSLFLFPLPFFFFLFLVRFDERSALIKGERSRIAILSPVPSKKNRVISAT